MSTDAQHLTRARFTEMERQLAAVTAQRDELLAALREIASLALGDDVSALDNVYGMANTTIAKVQS